MSLLTASQVVELARPSSEPVICPQPQRLLPIAAVRAPARSAQTTGMKYRLGLLSGGDRRVG